MAQIRQIKKRMVAVGNIQRITKTMQMIANTKFARALQRAVATRPYTNKIEQLVGQVVAAAGDVDHPLTRRPDQPSGRELIVLVASDRGLCGAYNANVLRAAYKYAVGVEASGRSFSLEVSGKKAVAFLRFNNIDIARRHQIGDAPRFEDVRVLADRYIESFLAGEIDAVKIIYMRFISNARQVPEIMQLLPMEATAPDDGLPAESALYEFSPSSEALLDDLLPRAVRTRLFQAFTDASVSEQIMRMVAMKAATENAKDLGRSLKRKYNRARQTRITTELMEVISGAAALE